MMPAAIGLRTAFMEQANSTAPGSSSPLGPRIALAFQLEHADQGEEPPRGVEIDLNLALEPLPEQRRSLVVQTAPRHVQRLDVRRRRVADGLEVAVADQEIVLDHGAERRQRQHNLAVWAVVLEPDVEDQPVLFQPHTE